MRLLALLAVAALAAACGGMSEDEYTGHVVRATDTVRRALAGASPDAGRLDAGSRAIAGAADDLAGTDPPGDDRRFNAEIVGGLREFAATLHQAAQAAREGDLGRRDDILAGLDESPGIRRLKAAVAELDRLSG